MKQHVMLTVRCYDVRFLYLHPVDWKWKYQDIDFLKHRRDFREVDILMLKHSINWG